MTLSTTPQPALVYHLTTPEAWAQAQRDGQLTTPSLTSPDAEGFIHASTGEQLCATADRYYAGADALLALAIDADAIQDALVFEAPHPPSPATQGLLFPHIYAPVPLDAIIAVVPLTKAQDGTYQMPENNPKTKEQNRE